MRIVYKISIENKIKKFIWLSKKEQYFSSIWRCQISFYNKMMQNNLFFNNKCVKKNWRLIKKRILNDHNNIIL